MTLVPLVVQEQRRAARECVDTLQHMLKSAEQGELCDVCIVAIGTDGANYTLTSSNYKTRERVACLTRLLHEWQTELWHEETGRR